MDWCVCVGGCVCARAKYLKINWKIDIFKDKQNGNKYSHMKDSFGKKTSKTSIKTICAGLTSLCASMHFRELSFLCVNDEM